MKTFIKNLGEHTFIFGLGNIIQGAISFLLLPVYLHYLKPSDYGIIALLDVISMIFGSIILQSIPTSLFRAYSFDYVNNTVEQKEAVGSAFIYLVVSSIICFSILILAAPTITGLVFKGSNPVSLVRLTFLTGLFNVPANIPLVVMRAKLQSKTMVTISIARGLSTIALNIFFVAYMKMSVAGVVWGNLIPAAVMFAISPLLLRNEMSWILSFGKLKRMLLFGWPLIPGFIGAWIFGSADRYLLEHLSTTSELGLYSLGYKFASILSIVILGPFQIAWPAIFFPKAKDEDALLVFQRFTTYFMLLGCGLGLCLVVGAEPAIRLMGPKEYWSAHIVVPVLVLSFLFGTGGLQEIMNVSLYIKDKTGVIPAIIGVGAVTNIILNVLLIPRYGMMGSAIATMIGSIIMATLTYMAGSRYYKISIESRRFIKILLIFIFITALNFVVRVDSIVVMIICKTALFLIYPVLLYVVIFNEREKREISSLISKSIAFMKGWTVHGDLE
jgi:O-antigen/teichoic acid export membrane protein